jgi:hypothetical protein
MSKQRAQQSQAQLEAALGRQPRAGLEIRNITPGRAAAEGSEITSPSHERWEQRTAERDPAEGADF